MGNLSECVLNRKLRDIGQAGSRKVILRTLRVQKAKVPRSPACPGSQANQSGPSLMPLFFVFRKKFEKPLRRASDSAQEKAAKETTFLQERLASVIQVQLLHQENNETQAFQNCAGERMKALNHRELVTNCRTCAGQHKSW